MHAYKSPSTKKALSILLSTIVTCNFLIFDYRETTCNCVAQVFKFATSNHASHFKTTTTLITITTQKKRFTIFNYFFRFSTHFFYFFLKNFSVYLQRLEEKIKRKWVLETRLYDMRLAIRGNINSIIKDHLQQRKKKAVLSHLLAKEAPRETTAAQTLPTVDLVH